MCEAAIATLLHAAMLVDQSLLYRFLSHRCLPHATLGAAKHASHADYALRPSLHLSPPPLNDPHCPPSWSVPVLHATRISPPHMLVTRY